MFSKDFFVRVIKSLDCLVQSFPNNQILDPVKLKAFADDKCCFNGDSYILQGRKHGEKGENAVQEPSLRVLLKTWHCVIKRVDQKKSCINPFPNDKI